MTVLIEVRTNGTVIGRCDAKCYQAQHTQCECICGGHNHGAGLQQAKTNTHELGEKWIEQWQQEHPGQLAELAQVIRQTELF